MATLDQIGSIEIILNAIQDAVTNSDWTTLEKLSERLRSNLIAMAIASDQQGLIRARNQLMALRVAMHETLDPNDPSAAQFALALRYDSSIAAIAARLQAPTNNRIKPYGSKGSIMKNEINFVAPDVSGDDRSLFLGPFDPEDGPFIEIEPQWSMAHIMHAAGAFPSVGQAKKNGWDRPIPGGYSEHTVGKRRLRIFILTSFE